VMKVCFVDLDGTITRPRLNNTFDFIFAFYKYGGYKYKKIKGFVSKLLGLMSFIMPFARGKIRKYQILVLFRGLDAERVREFVQKHWISNVRENLNSEVIDIISCHRRKGYRLVMLTACTESPARQISESLRFDDVISTTFVVSNGKIVGVNDDTFASSKARVLFGRYSPDVIKESHYIMDSPSIESQLLRVFKLTYIVSKGKVIRVHRRQEWES